MSAPLPIGWEAAQDIQTGRMFYIDHIGKTTQWIHPSSPSQRLKRQQKWAKKKTKKTFHRTAAAPSPHNANSTTPTTTASPVSSLSTSASSSLSTSRSAQEPTTTTSPPPPAYNRIAFKNAGHSASRLHLQYIPGSTASPAVPTVDNNNDLANANANNNATDVDNDNAIDNGGQHHQRRRTHFRERSQDDFNINVEGMTLRKAKKFRLKQDTTTMAATDSPTSSSTTNQRRKLFKRIESKDDFALLLLAKSSAKAGGLMINDDGRDTVRGRTRKHAPIHPDEPPMSSKPYGSTNLKRLLADFSM